MTTASERFYAELPTFDDFEGIIDFSEYRDVPDDWFVLISDVVSSTEAIRKGRYKDVNMLGAATITAALNSCKGHDVPFAFGGDGGTIVVPPSLKDGAAEALGRLASSAPELFDLEMRADAIPVGHLRKEGANLQIRKYRLSEGNHLAMFAGEGLELADRLMKQPGGSGFAIEAPDDEPPDLEGLSCRWEPLEPQHGEMVTIIVKPLAKGAAASRRTLNGVLEQAARVLGNELPDNAPASEASMRFRWPPAGLWSEAKTSSGGKGVRRRYAYLLMESFLQGIMQRFNLVIAGYDPAKYLPELRANTDFRKFDGTLRMVLDMTTAQADSLEAWLDGQNAKGTLNFGVHRADSALMTCLVFSFEQSEHVHFIDGADGGYAMAAADYKDRLAADAA